MASFPPSTRNLISLLWTRLFMQLGLKTEKLATLPILKISSPSNDACKSSEGFGNPVFSGHCDIGRMTKNMPRKLTDATLLAGSLCSADMIKEQTHGHVILTKDYIIMMKHMEDLEDKVITISQKPSSMPSEKEDILNTAINRVETLEQELLATKKALTVMRGCDFCNL